MKHLLSLEVWREFLRLKKQEFQCGIYRIDWTEFGSSILFLFCLILAILLYAITTIFIGYLVILFIPESEQVVEGNTFKEMCFGIGFLLEVMVGFLALFCYGIIRLKRCLVNNFRQAVYNVTKQNR